MDGGGNRDESGGGGGGLGMLPQALPSVEVAIVEPKTLDDANAIDNQKRNDENIFCDSYTGGLKIVREWGFGSLALIGVQDSKREFEKGIFTNSPQNFVFNKHWRNVHGLNIPKPVVQNQPQPNKGSQMHIGWDPKQRQPVCSPKIYPEAVTCYEEIQVVSTKIITVTASTATIIGAPSTITAYFNSATTTTATVTSTVTGPAFYQGCQSDNILSSYNSQAIAAVELTNNQDFINTATVDTAYDYCVACWNTANCAGDVFFGPDTGKCYLFIVGVCSVDLETPGAIGVHLLACMLAHIWTAAEATSIWVQIIEGRRQEIAIGFESGAEMCWQTFNAARPELSRKQVAEWDASARAWLRTADQRMILQLYYHHEGSDELNDHHGIDYIY
ncbi:hypothetical protein G7Y89_g12168 [Cudoniella acicularis]|uniref:Uncharacterized protein n=1 Tax=Cudoniella acicularis TaxID=354080 RepID=A0A8H4RAZ2_9HELO|nr:hypothetical protein G7Y89_g12168 [Cudoniella acicularis]